MEPGSGRDRPSQGAAVDERSLDCPGPVARNVTDAAQALHVIAGPDRHDSTAASVPVPDYAAGLEGGVKGLRIGLSPEAAVVYGALLFLVFNLVGGILGFICFTIKPVRMAT